MKFFISYAFTGEDEAKLRARLQNIKALFTDAHVDCYINIYDQQYQSLVDKQADGGEYLRLALKNMERCNTVLVVNTSERRSEGILMEVGAAMALGKKIVLAQHQSSVGKTYLPTVVNSTFVWNEEAELLTKIGQLLQGAV